MGFVAGPYIWEASLGPLSTTGTTLGVIDEPPVVEIDHQLQDINADYLGGQTVYQIYLGGPHTLDLVFQEFDKNAVQAILTSFDNLGGAGFNFSNNIASIGASAAELLSGTIHARAVSFGSGGGNTTPDHFVARRAVLSAASPISLEYGSRLRVVALRFTLFPYQFPVLTGTPPDPRKGNYFHFEQFTDAEFTALTTSVFKRDSSLTIAEALSFN